jgi:hypothetical protein
MPASVARARKPRRLGLLEGKMKVPARLLEPMSEEELADWNGDDLSWAKPLVDEGLSELDRGKAIPAEDVFARVEARLRATR